MNKVLNNQPRISLIIKKINETKLSKYSAKIYGEILGLHLRKYVAGKSIVVHYDRTPILRESDKQCIIINFHKWWLKSLESILPIMINAN